MDFENKPQKKLTPAQALIRAQLSCAYQERCQQEMRNKLYEWGLYSDAVENIISDLITTNYLNEERFSKTFAGGKFRIKKWGKIKIKIELKKRNISDYCIKKAMEEINDKDYIKTLKEIIAKKSHLMGSHSKGGNVIKGSKLLGRNYKIAQYAASRGFEQDLIWDIIKEE